MGRRRAESAAPRRAPDQSPRRRGGLQDPTKNNRMVLDKTTPDAEWRATLAPFEYKVLRQKGTEPRGGEYDKFYPEAGEGHFVCRGCNKPLYSAEAKFKSGCGWPAFDKCYKGAVEITEDNSHGMQRIEITCAGCSGHLGHVFVGERMTPTNEVSTSLPLPPRATTRE